MIPMKNTKADNYRGEMAASAAANCAELRRPVGDDARRLAARITTQLGERPGETGRVILFTGLAMDAGVSLMASQCARALLDLRPGRVALLDAKFNAPDLHTRFGLPIGPGLGEALREPEALPAAIHATPHPALTVLPAGKGGARVCYSDAALGELFAALRRQFRFTVVDASPLMQFISAPLIAAHADGVVLALAAGRHTRAQLREAQREVEMTRAALLGVALYESAKVA